MYKINRNCYLIIGYGRFGKGFAQRLIKEGVKETKIFIVDKKKEILFEAEHQFSNLIATSVGDFDLVNEFDINEIDIVIIAVSALEESLMIAANCAKYKKMKFYAKAKNEIHLKLLQALGVHKIVIPEAEVGSKIAYESLFDDKVDIHNINSNYNIIHLNVLNTKLNEKSLRDLDLKNNFGCNVIGITRNANFFMPYADDFIKTNDVVSIIVNKKNTKKIIDFFAKKN